MPSRDPRPSVARHVRRLHVRAGTDEDASKATTLLADALRTASLPGADDGRLVVIRHLALGRISAGVGSATLALHIEQATTALLSQAVIYDDRSADTAAAVAFPSRDAAIIALARQHARGATAGEWFWPLVVRGWDAAARPQRWLQLLDAAHQLPGALQAAAAVLEEALNAGIEDELLSAIPRGRGHLWLGGEPRGEPVDETLALPPLRRRHRECVDRWLRLWGLADDRVWWLGTIVTLHDHPALVASPRLPSIVARTLKPLEASEPPTGGWQEAPAPRRHPAKAPVLDRIDPSGRPDHSQPTETASRPQPEIHPAAPFSDGSVGTVTPHAGLLFIVAVLERLGFATCVETRSDLLAAAFPSQLLSFIGQRTGLTSDDPMAEFLPWVAVEPAAISGFAIADLPDRTRAVLTTPPPRGAVDSDFIAWLTAVRRWCRREARMGLTTLVRRPGRVVTSPTHSDVYFSLSRVDLRLRRLALDTDPGWVPWLGRAISFHYVRDDSR